MTNLLKKSGPGSDQEAKTLEVYSRIAAASSINGLKIAMASRVRSHFHPNDHWNELPEEERREWENAVEGGLLWLAQVALEPLPTS